MQQNQQQKQSEKTKLQNEVLRLEEEFKQKNGKITIKVNTGGLTSEVKLKITSGQVKYFDVNENCALDFAYEKGFTFYLADDNDGQIDESVQYLPQGPEQNQYFQNLKSGQKYWVVVIKDEDAEANRRPYILDLTGKLDQNQLAKQYGCTCKQGKPCINKQLCKNWENRMEIAQLNGFIPQKN